MIDILLCQTCADFVQLAQTYERRWQKALQIEQERRLRLEETVEALARQHNRLEEVCKQGSTEDAAARSPDSDADLLEADDDDDDDSFFDAVEDASTCEQEPYQLTLAPSHRRSTSDVSLAAPLLAAEAQEQGLGRGPLEGVNLHIEQDEKEAAMAVSESVRVPIGLPNALMPPCTVSWSLE